MSEKYQYFNGRKYTRDDKTGYYLNSTTRTRIHRAVWEYYNGKIPDGFAIHHKDGDKSNNDIENLELISNSEHATLHGNKRALEHYDEMVRNLIENAVPKAVAWSKSPEGREAARKRALISAKKAVPKEFVCKNCGKSYLSKNTGKNGFCCNNCKSAWRRKTGVDNIQKTCPVCGNVFFSNKYKKAVTCSYSCANRFRAIKRAEDGSCA